MADQAPEVVDDARILLSPEAFEHLLDALGGPAAESAQLADLARRARRFTRTDLER